MMDTYEYKRYVTTSVNLKHTIEKYGVAIIPSVLDETECDSVLCGLWDFFEHITSDWNIPIERSNRASWKGMYTLYPLHSMLFQHNGCGHAQICWDIRQNPKILK